MLLLLMVLVMMMMMMMSITSVVVIIAAGTVIAIAIAAAGADLCAHVFRYVHTAVEDEHWLSRSGTTTTVAVWDVCLLVHLVVA